MPRAATEYAAIKGRTEEGEQDWQEDQAVRTAQQDDTEVPVGKRRGAQDEMGWEEGGGRRGGEREGGECKQKCAERGPNGHAEVVDLEDQTLGKAQDANTDKFGQRNPTAQQERKGS